MTDPKSPLGSPCSQGIPRGVFENWGRERGVHEGPPDPAGGALGPAPFEGLHQAPQGPTIPHIRPLPEGDLQAPKGAYPLTMVTSTCRS